MDRSIKLDIILSMVQKTCERIQEIPIGEEEMDQTNGAPSTQQHNHPVESEPTAETSQAKHLTEPSNFNEQTIKTNSDIQNLQISQHEMINLSKDQTKNS
jgi:hypothetical protein